MRFDLPKVDNSYCRDYYYSTAWQDCVCVQWLALKIRNYLLHRILIMNVLNVFARSIINDQIWEHL